MIFETVHASSLVNFKNKMRRVTNVDIDLVQMLTDLYYVVDLLVIAKKSGESELVGFADDLLTKIDPLGSDMGQERRRTLLDQQLGYVMHEGVRMKKIDLEARNMREHLRKYAAQAKASELADYNRRLDKFIKSRDSAAR